jgi:hypothetical protein
VGSTDALAILWITLLRSWGARGQNLWMTGGQLVDNPERRSADLGRSCGNEKVRRIGSLSRRPAVVRVPADPPGPLRVPSSTACRRVVPETSSAG